MSASVAVIGLGAMGSRIASRLVGTGFDVVVWNRTPARAGDVERHGARVAASPAAAAADRDVVITMVTDAPACSTCVPVRPACSPACTAASAALVDMSTVGPTAVRNLAQLVPSGVELVDAPVLVSLTEAAAGTLTIFLGATEEGRARALPVISSLGTIVDAGPPGSGAAATLVANAALFGCVGLVGETLSLARAAGLRDNVAFDVLSKTPLAAQAARRRPAIDVDDFPPRFRLRLAEKDARLILGETTEMAVPMLAAVSQWLADADVAGMGDLDYSAVLRHILQRGARAG